MHILVTNDDGVNAPGLLALAQAMNSFGKVSILAPDRNWSGGGHVKTIDRPLRVKEFILSDGTLALGSDGAPSDCVALALLGYVDGKVDLVVSGINPVANLGHDVTYSGTVTAAMEAVIWGVTGIAVSLDSQNQIQKTIDFSQTASVTQFIVEHVISKRIPDGILLNINVPKGPIQGIQVTRQGLRVYRDRLDRRMDPRGNPYFWIGGDAPTGFPEAGTDVGALAEGYASVTPLQLDLTSYPAIHALKRWIPENLNSQNQIQLDQSNGRG
jgi:5'-nucleotidase